MLTQIINAIKDITGFRFYFLVFVLFAGFLLLTFKDEIKQLKFNPEDLQEISNNNGLKLTLDNLKKDDPLITGYIFFLYQPKHDSYYKRMQYTDMSFVKDNKFFEAMPLNAQKYLNYRLIEKEYTLLDYHDPEAVDYTNTYNSDYVLVYNVYVKETIAEVVLTFDIKPSAAQINVLLKKLRPIKYFVI